MTEIRIAGFDRHPRRAWVVDGLQCCTYAGHYGNLNGYVRLPLGHPDLFLAEAAEMLPGRPFLWTDGSLGVAYERGYDYVDVSVPGGWTYGPDLEGWIGFDTMHGHRDRWSVEDRFRFCESDEDRRLVEMFIDIDRRYGLGLLEGERLWTEEDVEREVETAARVLAMRARAAIRQRQEP